MLRPVGKSSPVTTSRTELQFLVPMGALVVRCLAPSGRKSEIHHGAVGAPLAGKYPREFDMVALNDQERFVNSEYTSEGSTSGPNCLQVRS